MNRIVKITKHDEYGEVLSMIVEPSDINYILVALEDLGADDMDIGYSVKIESLEVDDDELSNLELECF